MLGRMFEKLMGDANRAIRTYSGDKDFLAAAASLAANVTWADGEVEEKEIKKAKQVISANPIIKASYQPFEVEKAIAEALDRGETRSGRMQNQRFIEAMQSRETKEREDVFLIGVDVADVGDIGDDETKVLQKGAELLGVDYAALMG